jgi:very-short-patch-repair endonuclease
MSGWKDPSGTGPSTIDARNVLRDEVTVSEKFAEQPGLADAFAEWALLWNSWAESERPVRLAIDLFERLFAVRSRLQQEGERLELLLCAGRLVWQAPGVGDVDHPVLLQRVELHFDPSGPEISIVDTDRAPELYLPVLAIGTGGLSAEDATKFRADLDERGYHPLERPATSQFLRELARLLHPHGEYLELWTSTSASAAPHISHDPVLVLRVRSSGFPAALGRVIDDIESGGEIPVGLQRLVGIDALQVDPFADLPPHSPWGEPPDILLSKPANNEQVRIAQVLERYRAVLVQGPPGTGKSHTIANLVGHLVAQGKRVLVTSHTTKALSVLRDKVEPRLQPLCVALLDDDMKSRSQLEDSVRSILSRITQSNPALLANDERRLTRDRERLLAEVARCTDDLRIVREGEYADVLVGGERLAPAEAARWLAAQGGAPGWIPGPLEPAAPLPLLLEEMRWLYETNTRVSAGEEQQIHEGLPSVDSLPVLSEFEALAADIYTESTEDVNRWCDRPTAEEELDGLAACATVINAFADELTAQQPWQFTLIGAGHASDPFNALWEDLALRLDNSVAHWRDTLPLLTDHEPTIAAGLAPERALDISRQVLAHLEQGGGLGFFSVLFKSEWKRFLELARVQGRQPRSKEEFSAIVLHLELEERRRAFARPWRKLAEPNGLPLLDAIPEPRERMLAPYADQIRDRLGWWTRRWRDVSQALTGIGFQWEQYRAHEISRLAAAVPFEHDVTLTTVNLPRTIAERISLARRLKAQRLLSELRDRLSPFRGPTVQSLREAVEGADPVRYARALADLRTLSEKVGISTRRASLLERLGTVAPSWATALRERRDLHGSSEMPGDVTVAWRWRQCVQELDRRAAMSESELMKKLHDLRVSLRTATVSLIDCRALRFQHSRVDLTAQQALQGWAQTQKKIGRGTGKRVPALQVQARQQLAKARDAVPVWIMPLGRVAESFDLSRERFDVVIVDEASQSDCLGLLAWYLGKSIVVVGDDEQVSPLAVGQNVNAVLSLITQHLTDIPNAHLYDGRTSIYDLAGQCFGGTIALREHFRCVPDIIEFSNQLSYQGSMRPLRDPTRVPPPHLIEVVADSTVGTLRTGNKTSVAEARLIVALLKATIEHPRYANSTFGAITLLGDEQAVLIQRLALELIGAVDLDARRFAAGNSAQFQGDERSVMFLSMVDSPTGKVLSMSQLAATKQRYNVAASRAQDQLWLVHSLDPNRDLQQGDLRRRLIEHVRDPGATQRAFAAQEARTESPFEREVLRDLIADGYDVEPQVWVGRYRLDFVVRSGENQVAFECDGDRWHGFDKIADDLARQAVLERAGWRFVRVRGTQFYRDRELAMTTARERLRELGVVPTPRNVDTVAIDAQSVAFRQAIVSRAWDIMREQGWLLSSSEAEGNDLHLALPDGNSEPIVLES